MNKSKEIKITEFCEFVIRYCAFHSEERLTATQIARQLQVSRAWIYKYFSSDRKSWMKIAAKGVGILFTEEAYFPSFSDLETANKVWLQGAERLLNLFEERPWIGNLYFKYMGQIGHPIGAAILECEDHFVERATKIFQATKKGMNPTDARAAALALCYRRMAFAHAWIRKGPARHKIPRSIWLGMLMP